MAIVTIFPIENNTAEHLDDEMGILLSSIETSLVNSGLVNVVSRERQNQMVLELGMQRAPTWTPPQQGDWESSSARNTMSPASWARWRSA